MIGAIPVCIKCKKDSEWIHKRYGFGPGASSGAAYAALSSPAPPTILAAVLKPNAGSNRWR